MEHRFIRPIFVLLAFIMLTAFGMPLHAADAAPDSAAKIQKALTDTRKAMDLQTRWPDESLEEEDTQKSKDLQTRWPDESLEEEDTQKSRWFDWLTETLDNLSLGFSADITRYLLLIPLIVILAVILFHLKENLWSNSRSRRMHAKNKEVGKVETSERMDKAQRAAKDLAQSGSFAEAMHVLLLESVKTLRQRLDVSIAASLTSREILQRIALPPEGYLAFADIIRRVEVSYFGLHEPGEEEYQACCQNFAVLTRALHKEGLP